MVKFCLKWENMIIGWVVGWLVVGKILNIVQSAATLYIA